MTLRFRKNIPLFIMFVPVILFYVLFKYLPMFGVVIAFKDYNFIQGIMNSPWVGWKHFQILFDRPQSLEIIRNTIVLGTLTVFVGFPFPILLAILLNEIRKIWYKRVVQTLVYLPHFFSWVIVGGIALTLFSQETGIVNHVVKWLTGDAYPFLYKSGSWITIFLASGIWKEAGFAAIIYLAALSAIDNSLYEAASIDGANKWKQIINITIPSISPTIIIMFIISIGNVLEVGFDKVYVLKNPVVSDIAEVISTYIYRIGIEGAQFSFSAALGLFESVVGLVLVLLANRTAKKFGQGLW